jgi:hypothetical protein
MPDYWYDSIDELCSLWEDARECRYCPEEMVFCDRCYLKHQRTKEHLLKKKLRRATEKQLAEWLEIGMIRSHDRSSTYSSETRKRCHPSEGQSTDQETPGKRQKTQ